MIFLAVVASLQLVDHSLTGIHRATIHQSGFRKPYDDDLPGYCWDRRRMTLSAIGLQRWETEFATYLRDSEFKAFKKVKSCSITVDPTMTTTTELGAGTKPNGCPKRRLAKKKNNNNKAKALAKEDP